MKSGISKIILLGFVAIPLKDRGSWELLKFSSLPENKTTFSELGMSISVDKSASPIIYPLKKKSKVTALKVSGILRGRVNLHSKKQGTEGADDYELSIGLVLAGKKTLGTFQKMVAAKWIKKLYSLAPEGQGIDNILFLNATQKEFASTKERQHPLSELILKKDIWHLKKEGEFNFIHKFKKPKEVLAVWLSIDGDDTKSKFEILIKDIAVEVDSTRLE